MAQIQFRDEAPAVVGAWYWMKHKDSEVMFIGHLVEEAGRKLMTYDASELSESNFHRYLFAGPLEPPAEQPLGLQMAIEADNNRLLTPKEMIHDVLAAIGDPEDLLHKANKAIFIGVYSAEDCYQTATLRCNLSNSEAIALLTIKAHHLSSQVLGGNAAEG